MNEILSDSEILKVSDILAKKMGLSFPVERWSILCRNLASAAHEFGYESFEEFIQWLNFEDLTEKNIQNLASHLTVSETYFWREPQVFDALTKHVLPGLLKSKIKKGKTLRIWSAGCSSGEEAYSLAIAIRECIPDVEEWNIHILATDINPKVLEKAESGIYGPWSFRNTPEWIIKNYFYELENRKLKVIPKIRNMVTFACQSLINEDFFYDLKNSMDIIFCRNVLMYFTTEWIEKISNNFYKSIASDGWFIVSSSELSTQNFSKFKAVNFPGAILYQKGKNGNPPTTSAGNVNGIKSNLTDKLPPPLIPEIASSGVKANFIFEKKVRSVEENSLKEKLQAEQANRKKEIETPVEREAAFTAKLLAIRLLADQGYLNEALSLSKEAIEADKLQARYYYLQASIYQEMNNLPEAIKSLKQSIFIDQDYLMGHFTLGNLYLMQGNIKYAKRYLKNVLQSLRVCDDEEIPADFEGLSVKYIREIIKANMDTIEST